ncbi:hypothetical protein DIJ64_12865 [Mycobacterium leprae]|uniref:Uncharacterized protein n=1 Tax=Mycobacterium leprae TaxID=1769 RepID=A0AAD0KTG9_MYCLR|nr:hypothetical protein DIJ64_12865 [Mycobacterium leprae]OAX72113.1 hypothetical protein A3216_01285 [Mycobacterium leprae 7935681]
MTGQILQVIGGRHVPTAEQRLSSWAVRIRQIYATASVVIVSIRTVIDVAPASMAACNLTN